MTTKNEIIEIIFDSIEEINQQDDSEVKKDLNTKLVGSESDLNSIGLVNLITLVEERIEELNGRYIPLADERALSLLTSPFRTVETFVNYIEKLLNE